MFTGAIPAEKPEYAILIFLEDPQKNHSGGKSAAPFFVNVSKLILEEGLLSLKKETVINSENHYQPKAKNYNFLYRERVPNFKNQSLRESLTTLDIMKDYFKTKKIKLQYQVTGNGYVIKQTPPPNKKITNKMMIKLELTE